MKKYFLLLFILISSCQQKRQQIEKRITDLLIHEAESDSLQLQIDKVKIISTDKIYWKELYKDNLRFYREYIGWTNELIELTNKLNKANENELSQYNHLHPTPKDYELVQNLLKKKENYKNELEKYRSDSLDMENQIYKLPEHDFDVIDENNQALKVVYIIKGKVNSKVLNDTVKIYFSSDLKESKSFTNVLYADE